ncbi:Hypothetical_protein [Hexamita inflata]|uniref:Hypothetical_protein n=1 Tax=Hexamita inflata TaxID=28002 RepID=A0AA86NFY6_9EUKA|nr:Hypothetical protein HINF_LOCUS6654 [Hexamita inflata]
MNHMMTQHGELGTFPLILTCTVNVSETQFIRLIRSCSFLLKEFINGSTGTTQTGVKAYKAFKNTQQNYKFLIKLYIHLTYMVKMRQQASNQHIGIHVLDTLQKINLVQRLLQVSGEVMFMSQKQTCHSLKQWLRG